MGELLSLLGVFPTNYGNEESQYQVLAGKILQADIDLVIGFGEEMSSCLKHLSEIKVLEVYTSVNQLTQVTAAILKMRIIF